VPISLYAEALEGFLDGSISWTQGTIKVSMMLYGYSPSGGYFMGEDSQAWILATRTLTGKTATLGVADADDVVFGGLPWTGQRSHYFVVYQSSGPGGGADVPPNQQRNIFLWNPATDFYLAGNDMVVIWPDVSPRIFRV
jgi:hypothetical protein